MRTNDVLVDIYEHKTTAGVQAYTRVQQNVRALILPASQETIALYENAPVGQTFEFLIQSDAVTAIKGQSKLTVVSPQASGIAQNQDFITINNAQKVRVGGRNTLTGVCYQAE